MDQVTATLVVGLSTVVASGLFSSVVTYNLNRNKEQMLFLRGKAEDLFLAADEYEKILGGLFVTYFPLLDGRIDYNEMLDLQISQGAKPRERGGAETMEMLVEVYFPTTRAALADLWTAREKLNDLTHRIKQAYQAEGHVTHPEFKKEILEASAMLTEALKALKRAIVAVARTRAGVRQG